MESSPCGYPVRTLFCILLLDASSLINCDEIKNLKKNTLNSVIWAFAKINALFAMGPWDIQSNLPKWTRC